MARQVWKFGASHFGRSSVTVPGPARFVHFGSDPQEIPSVWVEVTPGGLNETVELCIVGTGHDIPDDFEHRGSLTTRESGLVLHLYEKRP
jgi:hypothetical protein